jgi:hypothetical protein
LSERFKELESATVGVLSDTHLPYRIQRLPSRVMQVFRDVDLILHAGDVDRIDCLADLADLAPVYAVRGNPHFGDLSDGGRDLPAEVRLTVAGCEVVVNHGGWFNFWTLAGDWFAENLFRLSNEVLNQRIARRLAQLYPRADLVIFGHSHRAYQAWHNGTCIFNPGAVCPTVRQVPSVGRLHLRPHRIEVEVVPLV